MVRKPTTRSVLGGILATALIGASAFVAFWAFTGGRWFVVDSPSMGTAAPVGTLLWVRPVPYQSIRVGEIITFHPPTELGQTFTHRVVAVNADGTLSTRGDINGATDPWHVHPSNVVGAVSMRWWAMGWLLRASPVLIFGGALLGLLATRFVRAGWRLPLAIAGSAALISISIYIYKPLVRATLITFVPGNVGGRATYVSTGLLPTVLTAPGHGRVSMHDGQLGSILTTHASQGRFPVTFGPDLVWWWWIAIVLVCTLPAFWTLIVGTLPRRTELG